MADFTDFIYKRPKTVILCTLLLLCISAAGILRIRLNLDLASLLPSDSPLVERFHIFSREFGKADQLIIAFEFTNSNDLENAKAAAERLARDVVDQGFVAPGDCDYKLDSRTRQALEDLLLTNFYLCLRKDELARLKNRIAPKGIRREIKKAKKKLTAGTLPSEVVRRDPLNFREVLSGHFRSSFSMSGVELRDRYYVSPDEDMLLFFAFPVFAPHEIESTLKLFEYLNTWKQENLGNTNIQMTIAGGYAIAHSDYFNFRRALLTTFISSAILVFILLYFFFSRLKVILIILIPLLISVVITLGIAGFFLQKLTLVTASFAAIIIGLGIDFAIHFYNRYCEEIHRSSNKLNAVNAGIHRTGKGILFGAVTTSIAFYTLMIGNFKGVSQLGFLTGTGILVVMAGTFTLMPALIRLFLSKEDLPPCRSFGLDRLAAFISRMHRPLAAGLILFCLLAGAFLCTRENFGVRFDTNPRNLRPSRDPAFDAIRKIETRFGKGLYYFCIMAEGDTFEECLTHTYRIRNQVINLLDSNIIRSYKSLADYLIPAQKQQENISAISEVDFETVKKAIRANLIKRGFTVEKFSDIFERINTIQRRVKEKEILTLEQIRSTPVTNLLGDFYKEINGRHYITTYIVPEKKYVRSWTSDDFEKYLLVDNQNIFLVGMPALTKYLQRIIAEDFKKLTMHVLLIVFVILILCFRSVRASFLGMVPVLSGAVMVILTMHLVDIRLNFLNVIVIPVIIGIGIDSGIHIINRFTEGGDHPVERAVKGPGAAIIMTTLTTMGGFGSLVFGEYRGLISMGLLTSLGLLYCMTASLIFLPALLKLFGQRQR